MADLSKVLSDRMRHRPAGDRGSGVYVTLDNGTRRQLVQGHGVYPNQVPGTVRVRLPGGRLGFVKTSEFIGIST